IPHFLAAEAARSQGGIIQKKKGLGHERPAQANQSVVHRRCRIDGDLLFQNDVQQGTEAVTAPAKPRRTRGFQNPREHRLCAESCNPVGETARRIWSSFAMAHPDPSLCSEASYGIVAREPLATAGGRRARCSTGHDSACRSPLWARDTRSWAADLHGEGSRG